MTLPQSLLDRLASAAVAEGLADAVYTRLSTPIGTLTVVQGPRGVVRVGFEREPVDALLAEVAAGLGPRIVASDRELEPGFGCRHRRNLDICSSRLEVGAAGEPAASKCVSPTGRPPCRPWCRCESWMRCRSERFTGRS